MNMLHGALKRSRAALNSRTAKVGGYSFIMAIVVLCILIAVNIAVSLLPSTWTQFDISAARLYSVTSATKAEVQNLDSDVTIYLITQAGSEDSVIERLLDVYGALSDHITVEKKNPDVYPTFASQYTDDTVANNSLVVECGDRYRYIAYSEIYDTDTSSYYTTGSVSYSFDGESCITAAIDYVTTTDLPKMYLLSGHGEAELGTSFTSALTRQNIETDSLSLLTSDSVPEDADVILVNAPTSDISAEEADMLRDYLADGGKLMVISGPQDGITLDNLDSILEDYNVTVNDGIVIEGDRDHYAFSAPYMLLPELGDSDITNELSENNSNIVVSIAQGLTVGDAPSGVTVTPLLTTTDASFSKIDGYDISTYDKEDNDIDGPFAAAVSITDSTTGASIVWIASDNIMSDDIISYSSGANSDFTMNSLSYLIGETNSIAIRSKSLDYSYLTISNSQATLIKVCLIGIIPLAFLAYGLEDVLRRRKQA